MSPGEAMESFVTESYGEIRHGRVWFTTSPAELKQRRKPSTPAGKKVVVTRRNGQEIRRVVSS